MVKGTHDIMVVVLEIDMATHVQILNEVICISFGINIIGKGMKPVILPPADIATNVGEGKLN